LTNGAMKILSPIKKLPIHTNILVSIELLEENKQLNKNYTKK